MCPEGLTLSGCAATAAQLVGSQHVCSQETFWTQDTIDTETTRMQQVLSLYR